MSMDHQPRKQLRIEIRALRRKKSSAAGVTLDLLDQESAAKRRMVSEPQGAAANLDGGEVPSGGETMVSVRKEKGLRVESGLDVTNVFGTFHRPDLVLTAEAVGYLVFRRLLHLKQRRQRSVRVIAPKPETTKVISERINRQGARVDKAGNGFLVWMDGCLGSIEQSHDSVANRIFLVARKAETLTIDEERGFGVLDAIGVYIRCGRVFPWDIGHRCWGTERPKGQKNSHYQQHSRGLQVAA
jgi:hypothetical protein